MQHIDAGLPESSTGGSTALRNALQAMGLDVTRREAAEVLASFDGDASGCAAKKEPRYGSYARGDSFLRAPCSWVTTFDSNVATQHAPPVGGGERGGPTECV